MRSVRWCNLCEQEVALPNDWTHILKKHVCFGSLTSLFRPSLNRNPSEVSFAAERSPHLPLLVLRDQVTVEVLQGHLGHGDPLLGVVTHGGEGALTRHRHAVSANRGWSQQSIVGQKNQIKPHILRRAFVQDSIWSLVLVRSSGSSLFCSDATQQPKASSITNSLNIHVSAWFNNLPQCTSRQVNNKQSAHKQQLN